MITVIMPSYLNDYPGSRSNPIDKFKRSVNSFVNQTLKQKELIIVSDGCEITNSIYEQYYKSNSQIKLIKYEKQKGWPGPLRQMARRYASYEWIIYLDTDDFYLIDYLEYVCNHIIENKEIDFDIIRFKKFIYPLKEKPDMFDSVFLKIELDKLIKYSSSEKSPKIEIEGNRFTILYLSWGGYNGTWQIAHRNTVDVKWEEYIGLEGGEDVIFINKLSENYKSLDIEKSKYVIAHYNYKGKDKIIKILDV